MTFTQFIAVRPTIGRFALAVFAVAIVIGLSFGLTSITSDASDAANADRTALERYAGSWQSSIGARLSQAISLATSAGTFCGGGATSVPNHAGTIAERIQFINNASWAVMAATLFAQVPGILSLQTQPSGVVAQIWPPGSAPVGLDVWNLPGTSVGYRQFVIDGVATANGPVQLAQGGVGILARYPVFLGTAKTYANWWGAGVAVFRVSELVQAMNISTKFAQAGYAFVLYSASTTNASLPREIIVASPTAQGQGTQLPDSYTVRLQTTDPNFALYLNVAPVNGLAKSSPKATDVVAVVLGTVGAGLLLAVAVFLLAYIGYALRHRHVPVAYVTDGGLPFALVAVRRMGWWLDKQDANVLHADLLDFEREAGRIAASCGCYLSGRVSDGCVLVVGKSADRLADFALAARDKLPSRFRSMPIARTDGQSQARGRGGGGSSRHKSPQRPASHARAASSVKAGGVGRTTSTVGSAGGASETHRSQVSKVSKNSDRPREAGFEFAIALHAGALRSSYNAENDRHTFYGASIAAAAVAVDATQTREVTATEAFGEASQWEIVTRAATTRRLDDDQTVLYIFEADEVRSMESSANGSANGAAHAASNNRRRSGATYRTGGGAQGRGGHDSGDASVATAVSAKSGNAVRKRVAMLGIELLPAPTYSARSRDPVISSHPAVLDAIAAATVRHGGELVSILDTRVVIAFNALTTVTAPARHAADCDADIRLVLADRRLVSVVTQGFAHVAALHGHVVCIGDAPLRCHENLSAALALNAQQEGFGSSTSSPLERTCLADTLTAEELRQAFELQCIGYLNGDQRAKDLTRPGDPRPVKATLNFSIERAWPDEDSDADDEWLYRLQKLESSSPFTPLNAAFQAIVDGKANKEMVEDMIARCEQGGRGGTYNPVAVQAFKQLATNAGLASGSSTTTVPSMVIGLVQQAATRVQQTAVGVIGSPVTTSPQEATVSLPQVPTSE